MKTIAKWRSKFPKDRDIHSGDQMTDFIFRQLIVILEEIVDKIRKKENLRDPDKPRKHLWGILTDDQNIFLEARTDREEIFDSFIHELTHALFHERMKERAIKQITNILCRRLTADQKKILKSYIPRHKVKHGPPKTT